MVLKNRAIASDINILNYSMPINMIIWGEINAQKNANGT